MSIEMRAFAENLKRERLSSGMTQQQMADALRIPLRTYRTYESISTTSRAPDLEMVVKIAKVLETTTDELLGAK